MNIGIVGLGLIGGSLGLDLRASRHRVYGLSRNPETCNLAIQLGIVDEAATQPGILSQVDVVFLCPPIGAIFSSFEQIQSSLRPQAVVTDVGSVKGAITPSLHSRWPYFIGGHPMAGTAESGINAAQSRLFRDRPYVLTPLKDTAPQALDTLKALVQDLGAKLYIASPEEHDRAVSLISHLPIVISASLIATCVDSDHNNPVITLAQSLASSGFRDTSRVGGGNPELGRMVAEFNQGELLRSLDIYQRNLRALSDTIANQNWEQFQSMLTETQQALPHFLDE